MGSLENLEKIRERIGKVEETGDMDLRCIRIGVENTIYSLTHNRITDDKDLKLIVKGYRERLKNLTKRNG